MGTVVSGGDARANNTTNCAAELGELYRLAETRVQLWVF